MDIRKKIEDDFSVLMKAIDTGDYSTIKSTPTPIINPGTKKIKPQGLNIIDCINSWQDILDYSGKTEDDLPLIKKPKTRLEIYLNAIVKINLITEVYNEGIILDWDNKKQYKYLPWFEKKSSGWVFDYVGYSYVNASTGLGVYYTTEEKAKDAAIKFLAIYQDYLP